MRSFVVRPKFLYKNFSETRPKGFEGVGEGNTRPPEIRIQTNDRASQDLKKLLDPPRFPIPAAGELMRKGLTRMKKEGKAPKIEPSNAPTKGPIPFKKQERSNPRVTAGPKPLGDESLSGKREKTPEKKNTPQASTSSVRNNTIGKTPKRRNEPRLMFDRKEKNWAQKLFQRTPKTEITTGNRSPKNTGIGTREVTPDGNNTKKNWFSRLIHRNPRPEGSTQNNMPQETKTKPALGRKIVTGLKGVFGPTPNGPNGTYTPRLMFDRNEKNWVQKLFTRNK